jgi:hypothetical protein
LPDARCSTRQACVGAGAYRFGAKDTCAAPKPVGKHMPTPKTVPAAASPPPPPPK